MNTQLPAPLLNKLCTLGFTAGGESSIDSPKCYADEFVSSWTIGLPPVQKKEHDHVCVGDAVCWLKGKDIYVQTLPCKILDDDVIEYSLTVVKIDREQKSMIYLHQSLHERGYYNAIFRGIEVAIDNITA